MFKSDLDIALRSIENDWSNRLEDRNKQKDNELIESMQQEMERLRTELKENEKKDLIEQLKKIAKEGQLVSVSIR